MDRTTKRNQLPNIVLFGALATAGILIRGAVVGTVTGLVRTLVLRKHKSCEVHRR